MVGTVVRPCPPWLIRSIRNLGLGSGESSSAFSPIRHAPVFSCDSWHMEIRGSSCIERRSERTRLPDGSGVNREVHAPFCERPAGEIPPAYSPRPEHEDVSASRTSPLWRTMPFTDPARPLEDNDVYRSAQAIWHDRADGPRRCDERRRVPGLCRTGSHSNLGTGRHRHHGQSACTQGGGSASRNRRCGMPVTRPSSLQSDFNPIEKAFAKLKAVLRAKAERTVEGLWNTVGQIVTLFEPQECANYFKSCGYDPE